MPAFPAGFTYHPGFLTVHEEALLIQAIAQLELSPLIFQGFTAKRMVKSFGYNYDLDHRHLSKGEPIPAEFQGLLEKVASFIAIPAISLAEMLLTAYPEGAVINWHRDAPPFDIIVGISLLADCNFRFRRYKEASRKRNSVISLQVQRRSLYVIKDEARNEWEHSIPALEHKRYSITFRTLRTFAP